jgi:hypothetical protein
MIRFFLYVIHDFGFRFLCRFGFGFLVLCCGGLFATASTARVKRAHASGSSSGSLPFTFEVLAMSFLTPKNSNATPPLWVSALFAEKRLAERQIPFYAALGRFVTAYALAEAGVHITARHFSGLSDEHARVIFGGMRLGDLSERLRKLTDDTQYFSEIDELLTQLDGISKERDKLVHRLVEYDSKAGLTVTNKLTVKSIENVEVRNFSVQELSDMESDCKRIYFRLTSQIKGIDGPSAAKFGFTILGLHAPWQYKRPQQANKKKPPRASARSHRHQRHASHESQ